MGGSKITADGDCSHEIRRRLHLGRKVKTNRDTILKSKDITVPTKVCIVKAKVFPGATHGCKSWTIKKAECSAVKKNSFESVLMRWMKLEPIIQSEVSQKEKHQYSILTHIYGI